MIITDSVHSIDNVFNLQVSHLSAPMLLAIAKLKEIVQELNINYKRRLNEVGESVIQFRSKYHSLRIWDVLIYT